MELYTGLKGTIKIRKEMIGNFSEFLFGDLDIGWEGILPKDHGWLSFSRNAFIPFGAISYMPDSWDDIEMNLNKETREFTFACSLKNYEGEIGYFIENVLPLIAEAWTLEELYEEAEYGTLHTFGDTSSVKTEVVTELLVTDYYLHCPHCNKRQDGFNGDCRDDTFTCDDCGEDYTIHKEAEWEMY